MDIDPAKVLIHEKVEKALYPADPSGAEYVVAGEAIGEEGLIPVALDAHATDGNCIVTIADGHRTGEQVTVPDRYVTAFGKEFVEDASKRLFR